MDDIEVLETMNNYVVVKELQIKGFKDASIYDEKRDNINRSIIKFINIQV